MPERKGIKRLLIANRSEIACRIMRTAREIGIETLAVYSEPDRRAAHVALADAAFALGGDTPATSYLDIQRVVDVALAAEADAVHPGYGFLAENATFARAVTEAGLVFVGPTPETIAVMGDKISARALATDNGLPMIPAVHIDGDTEEARAASSLGFPVLVKAAAGGGGRGMRVVGSPAELSEAIASARREARSSFGDDRVYLEKYLADARHVEVQIFGDGRGTIVHLGERECSVQRRHQKIIEEAPSPFVTAALREDMTAAAVRLAAAMEYRGAGTVEFVVDPDRSFYFLEMNTRLQVEHAVTEAVTSTDLVRWQLDVAAGDGLPGATPETRGHAIECRVYAEDPANGFLPTAGRILRVEQPAGAGIRVDSALFDGFEVPVDYDPMLAKVIAWAPDRDQARVRMLGALRQFVTLGIVTNVPFLLDVLQDPAFRDGAFTTSTVEQRYGAWSRESGEDLELAAVAAGLLARSRGAGARPTGNHGPPGVRGPWETLGAWRIGSDRSGGAR